MSGTSKQIFDLGQVSPIRYFFAVAFILGVLFAFISQGDDGNRAFIWTFIQWQLQTGLPIALLILSHMFLSRFLKFEKLNPWLQLSFSGVIGVVFFTPFALLFDYLFGQDVFLSGVWHLQLWDELMGMGPPVIISWLAMNAPWILGYRINHHELVKSNNSTQDSVHGDQMQADTNVGAVDHQSSPIETVEEATFFQLLPAAIGTDVIYLKAELHYIEVNTIGGQALILYNLRDAIDELSYLSGIQCHRSYWVNLSHIKNFKKQGRQGQLLLTHEYTVPVSRTRLQAVGKFCQSQ